MIGLLILNRDLILLNFSFGTELIIIPLSIPAPNSDWIIFSSDGLRPYQTISSEPPSYGLARTSLKFIIPLLKVLISKTYEFKSIFFWHFKFLWHLGRRKINLIIISLLFSIFYRLYLCSYWERIIGKVHSTTISHEPKSNIHAAAGNGP